MLIFISAIFGLIIGSFLNVCIFRMPKDLSIAGPRSFCPYCNRPVAFYDNIPVISYMLLKGKCRNCSAPISWRYPAVELLTAVLTAVIAVRWSGLWAWSAACLVSCYILIVVTFIDLETFLIPDELSLGLAGLGLVSSFANPYFSGTAVWKLFESIAGGGAGFILVWVLAVTGEKIFKKEAMGGGDLKLMAGLGTLLGWQGAVSTFIIGSVLGSVYGIILMIRKKAGRGDPIPFGPFLAAGAVINLFKLVPLSAFLWV